MKEKRTEGAVEVFCDKLRQHIESHLIEDIPRKAVDRILDDHKYKKHTLQVKLLTSLADKKSFHDYMEMKNNMYAYSDFYIFLSRSTAPYLVFLQFHSVFVNLVSSPAAERWIALAGN